MALLDSEISRIRYELGFHVLTSEAMPYVGTVNVFEQAIQQWVEAGASTTSSTAVSLSTSTLTSLTLALATGFSVGDPVVIDVGPRQEKSVVQSVSGNVISCVLSGTHSGTYPVTVEGGESIIREILAQIAACRAQKSTAIIQVNAGQVRKVDEVEYYKSDASTKQTGKEIDRQLRYLQGELAIACGVGDNHVQQSLTIEPY